MDVAILVYLISYAKNNNTILEAEQEKNVVTWVEQVPC